MAAAYSSHAKSPSVLLGYPDEEVSAAVDFTTNVIGGMPVSDKNLSREVFSRYSIEPYCVLNFPS